MKGILTLVWSCLVVGLMGQTTPYINSISPITAKVGETVTIAGSGFSATSTDLRVLFGGVSAPILSSTTNLIEVSVPQGASHDEIMVINVVTGYSASSSQLFFPNYGGDSFDNLLKAELPAFFDSEVSTNTNQKLAYDLCMCDFNGDGLNDIVITAQENPTTGNASRLVYQNSSTLTTPTFTIVQKLRTKPSSKVNCKDMNGDGKPDLIVSEYNDPTRQGQGTEDVEVYLNTSTLATISFETTGTASNDPITELVLARDINNNLRKPFKIELEDIDNDGRPDILASNQSDNYIDIFLNTTTGFSLSFRPTPVQVAIPDGKSARAMRLGDLNNDGLIDLVIGYDVSGLYVCENLSTTGNVKFRDPQLISSTDQSSIRNIEVGDFNGDGYSDLAASVLIQGSSVGELLLIKNATTSNGGNIQFSPLVKTTVSKGPWGITTGDIDGDGDIDILLAHAESNSIDLVINRSTSSTLNFNALALPTLKNSRNIKVADLNGDAKSDIAFISNSLSNQTDGFLSIFLNRNCVTPQITPATGEYCPGNSFILTATPGQGLTYDWKVNNVSVQNSASNTFDISAYSTDITVSVTTTSTDGKCIKSSATASYTVNMATPPTPPSFTASATQVCVGESIQLTSNVVADNYFWTGPDNFTGNTSSVTIPVDNAAKAGKYNLVVQNLNGCKSQAFTQTIEVFATPFPKIINNGLDNFCIGGSTILTTSSQNGFTLQWNKDGVAIPAATTTNLNVNATGIYTLTLTSNALTRCKETSPDYPINEVAPPVPTITTALDTCVNLARTFAGGISAGASQYGISYQWDFLDSNNTSLGTDSIQNATFTFATAGTYTAKLTTGYRDIANCTNTTTQSVTASAVPTISITSAATQKCRLDSMLLEIPAGMISYSWSTGSTTSSTYAKTLANQDTANVTSTIVTPLGCTVISTIQITNFTRPLDITSVDFNLLNDTLNIPAGTSKITLSATGGVNYRWSPSLIFDDSTATTVVVRPRSVVSYITLSATDDFGCDEQSFLYMENSNVQARKSFSPNGDGQGFDCWEILNSSLLSGCTVYVFNKQGRTIFQKDAPFENDCVWNGIDVNGNAAPEGIYYFVMKCEDTATSRTGTILLGR